MDKSETGRESVAAVYRAESRRVLATLIRLLGNFDLAEEALHDAFMAALEQWPRDGAAREPPRLARLGGPLQGHRPSAAARPASMLRSGNWRKLWSEATAEPDPDGDVEDDRLRLVFTCCHPALAPDARVA